MLDITIRLHQPLDDIIPSALQPTLRAHAEAHSATAGHSAADPQKSAPFAANAATATPHVATANGRPISGIEHRIEHFLRPQVNLLGKRISAYNAFGVSGIVLAVTIALSLTIHRGLPLWVMIALLLLTLVVAILNIVLTTIITGRDSLVYLRYFLSIMAAGALLLRILEQPVLPHLENLMLGIGAMQGIGRIGCLRVGCCYGKPARYGIRYTDLHARAGFPSTLVGVRLFPVQLLESAWILISAGTGITIAIISNTIGLGFTTYLLMFAGGRFGFELLRGDCARPYWLGLSEAQWISAGLVLGVLVLSLLEILPYRTWQVSLGTLLIILMIGWRFFVMPRSRYQLRQPVSIFALSKALSSLDKGRRQELSGNHAVHMRSLLTDLQLSDGVTEDAASGKIRHYTLSYANRAMPIKDAQIIAKTIQSWHPQEEKAKLIIHNNKIFHFLRYQPSES